MSKSTKSKWIIGLTGTAFSAFVVSQIGSNHPNTSTKSESIVTASMSTEEKEFVQFDWFNYAINGVTQAGRTIPSDTQSRRS